MHLLKKLFIKSTGYWLHKVSTLPIGADLQIDIQQRIRYGQMKVMFDVGANIGQTWEWFRKYEPRAKIYCFEPVLNTFETLKLIIKNDTNCIVENTALGDEVGEKIITIFKDNSALNSLKDGIMNTDTDAVKEKIKINTIDEYCLVNDIGKIDFLKIDTEGYELNVLKGAVQMINTAAISMIFCEVGFLKANNRNTYFADLSEWLSSKDYQFFGLYHLVSNGSNIEFGNALFIHKDIFNC